jgi:DNA end-binding protein Ku
VATLIDERSRRWDPALAADPVQARLLDIIAAKKKGHRARVEAPPPEAPPRNVINIMDALRKSLASEKRPPQGK